MVIYIIVTFKKGLFFMQVDFTFTNLGFILQYNQNLKN